MNDSTRLIWCFPLSSITTYTNELEVVPSTSSSLLSQISREFVTWCYKGSPGTNLQQQCTLSPKKSRVFYDVYLGVIKEKMRVFLHDISSYMLGRWDIWEVVWKYSHSRIFNKYVYIKAPKKTHYMKIQYTLCNQNNRSIDYK